MRPLILLTALILTACNDTGSTPASTLRRVVDPIDVAEPLPNVDATPTPDATPQPTATPNSTPDPFDVANHEYDLGRTGHSAYGRNDVVNGTGIQYTYINMQRSALIVGNTLYFTQIANGDSSQPACRSDETIEFDARGYITSQTVSCEPCANIYQVTLQGFTPQDAAFSCDSSGINIGEDIFKVGSRLRFREVFGYLFGIQVIADDGWDEHRLESRY